MKLHLKNFAVALLAAVVLALSLTACKIPRPPKVPGPIQPPPPPGTALHAAPQVVR